MAQVLGLPGKLIDRCAESAVVTASALKQGADWALNFNRRRILTATERMYPRHYRLLDGGSKRIIRAFLDPETVSNTYSMLGGRGGMNVESEYRSSRAEVVRYLLDVAGSEATFDNSFVEVQRDADGADATEGPERWFFINGIATGRDLARRNVTALYRMFRRPFTLIHNPTHGLLEDLVECALQKFTNINTEPVARAFLHIADALLDDRVEAVVVIAHSQGTMVMGDVLDLIYGSFSPRCFELTNMYKEEFESFMSTSTGTVNSAQLQERQRRLREKGGAVVEKLQLYMFSNAASRMCYLDPERRIPHIESYANEHDIVARLGVLARPAFHHEDLLHIDGSLFTCRRYGHLLNAHYLPEFERGHYELRVERPDGYVGTSIHDPVQGNPCLAHPDHVPGPRKSRLFTHYERAQRERGGEAMPLKIAPASMLGAPARNLAARQRDLQA